MSKGTGEGVAVDRRGLISPTGGGVVRRLRRYIVQYLLRPTARRSRYHCIGCHEDTRVFQCVMGHYCSIRIVSNTCARRTPVTHSMTSLLDTDSNLVRMETKYSSSDMTSLRGRPDLVFSRREWSLIWNISAGLGPTVIAIGLYLDHNSH